MRTSAASARSIGRSRYLRIRACMRDASCRSSAASASASPSTISHSASWARDEKPSRYIASVSAGQTVTSGSRIACSASTHAAWCASAPSSSATSGPASTRTAGTGLFLYQRAEPVARVLRQTSVAAVRHAHEVLDRFPRAGRRGRMRGLVARIGGNRFADDVGPRSLVAQGKALHETFRLRVESNTERHGATTFRMTLVYYT